MKKLILNFGRNKINLYTKQIFNYSSFRGNSSSSSVNESSTLGIDEYLEKMDFSKVISDPIHGGKTKYSKNISNEQEDQYKSEELVEKLSILLKSDKIREKGAQYLINNMLQLYKVSTGRNTTHHVNTYDNYLQNVNFKTNKIMEQNIRKIFSSNTIIDSIQLIMRHITDIKTSELEKLINLLIKIKYSNFSNWKIILKQYIMYMSLLETHYQPLRSKDIAQILQHLKNIYTFLPYDADKEVQTLIERSINESIRYLIKNFESMSNEEVCSIMNSISKLGYLDEHNCSKIEQTLITKLDKIPPEHFVLILFCICRNRCASNEFLTKLEQVSESILDSYLNRKEVDPFVIAMMAKSFYYGFRSKNSIFKNTEEIYLKFSKQFEIHQTIIISYSLVTLDQASEEFCRKVNDILSKLKNTQKLTEMLTFQVLNMISKRKEFSDETLLKYLNLYNNLMEKNEVRQKQAFAMIRILNSRLIITENTDVKEKINEYIQIFKKFGDSLKHKQNI